MFGKLSADVRICTVVHFKYRWYIQDMSTIFPIHSQERRPLRETEHEYFVRMAREHARNQRRARRERMIRKLTRRPSAERRPA
jgi:hypothetical protein